jgi:uncharacterized iron-regulated protein
MRYSLIILILLTLVSCSSNTQLTVEIIDTHEKTKITDEKSLYSAGDTIIIIYDYTMNTWSLDKNWIDFDSTSYQVVGSPRYYKAIVK